MTIHPNPAGHPGWTSPVRRLLAAAASLVALAAAFPVSAVPLADETSMIQCSTNNAGVVQVQVDFRDCDRGDAGLGAFGEIRTSPFPAVFGQASALGSAAALHHAVVNGSLNYEFELQGGKAGDLVPVLILVELNAAANDPAHSWGLASMVVDTFAGSPITVSVCTAGVACGGSDAFSGLVPLLMQVGGPNASIDLSIEVFAGDGATEAFASALVQGPYIFVDPRFANAAQYSINVSFGVGNVPPNDQPIVFDPVPEPASIWLCVVALAAAGLRARRR